jgi:hypothetical protein
MGPQSISHSARVDHSLRGLCSLLRAARHFIYALNLTVITRVIVYASTCGAADLRWRAKKNPGEAARRLNSKFRPVA